MNNPENTPRPPRFWRITRRWIFGLAVFATLIAVAYTEEDVRGKRAWESTKRELEAQGFKLDWSAFIPPPVPDDRNSYGVPEMQKWFVVRGATELSKMMEYPGYAPKTPPPDITVAELIIGPPGGAAPDNATTLRMDDPKSREEILKLIKTALGPSCSMPQGMEMIARHPDELRPARILLQCQTKPSQKDLEKILPDLKLNVDATADQLHLQPSGENTYHVTHGPIILASDFLAWSDTLEPQVALIRTAAQRPFSRLPGDYEHSMQCPIPNFVTQRAVAQMLGARMQAHLLTGKPDEALQDVETIGLLCRLLESRPTGHPTTLVAAMINVAIRSLCAGVIGDGFRLGAWREPELAGIQQQFKDINLPEQLKFSFDSEAAGVCDIFKNFNDATQDTLRESFRMNDKFLGIHTLRFIPKGWLYQNMAAYARVSVHADDLIDGTNCVLFPQKMDRWHSAMQELTNSAGVYTMFAKQLEPNLDRAFQTCAKNQALVSFTIVACALERYRLANHEYPETLEALAPRFIGGLPRDVIDGGPLHYRRSGDGKFLLYSIGWNERDDGGVPGKAIDDGDCVWASDWK